MGLGGGSLDKYSLTEGVATVRRALELGVSYFDTSPAYCQGASQVILGNALEGCTEPYLLATKLGYLAAPADFRSRDAFRAQLWENLRALRRSQVDVLQVHMAEWACWWKDGVPNEQLLSLDEAYDLPNAPVMEVLHEARERGLCRFIGITSDPLRSSRTSSTMWKWTPVWSPTTTRYCPERRVGRRCRWLARRE